MKINIPNKIKKLNTKKKNIQIKKRSSLTKNGSKILSIYIVIFLLFGSIMFFLGKDISALFNEINNLQKAGFSFLVLGIIAYLVKNCYKEWHTSKIARFFYPITVAFLLLFIITYLCFSDLLTLKISLFLIGFFLSAGEIALKGIDLVKSLNHKITDEVEKITILIAFFGIIISLITIIK